MQQEGDTETQVRATKRERFPAVEYVRPCAGAEDAPDSVSRRGSRRSAKRRSQASLERHLRIARQRRCLSHEGSGNTRQRQCLTKVRDAAGNTGSRPQTKREGQACDGLQVDGGLARPQAETAFRDERNDGGHRSAKPNRRARSDQSTPSVVPTQHGRNHLCWLQTHGLSDGASTAETADRLAAAEQIPILTSELQAAPDGQTGVWPIRRRLAVVVAVAPLLSSVARSSIRWTRFIGPKCALWKRAGFFFDAADVGRGPVKLATVATGQVRRSPVLQPVTALALELQQFSHGDYLRCALNVLARLLDPAVRQICTVERADDLSALCCEVVHSGFELGVRAAALKFLHDDRMAAPIVRDEDLCTRHIAVWHAAAAVVQPTSVHSGNHFFDAAVLLWGGGARCD